MVIARNTTELKWIEESENFKRERLCRNDDFYEVPKNKTLLEVFKEEYEKCKTETEHKKLINRFNTQV